MPVVSVRDAPAALSHVWAHAAAAPALQRPASVAAEEHAQEMNTQH